MILSEDLKRLISLGDSMFERFERLGELADLDKAIEYENRVVSLIPLDDPDLPEQLSSLAVSLHTRFLRLGNIADLNKAIEYGGQEVSLTPPDQTNLPKLLVALSIFLHDRFELLDELADLEQAIAYQNRAVSLTLPGHSDLPWLLDNLGYSQHIRFDRLGVLEDLNKAIECRSRAVSIKSQNDSDLAKRLTYLSSSLDCRFKELGELTDLNKVIECEGQAISLTPLDDSNLPQRLDSLGISLHSLFNHRGDLADLDRSIEYTLQAISHTPENDPDLPDQLNRLGVSLHSRFGQSGDLTDLDKAINYKRKAISLTPEGGLDRPMRLSNLSISLHARFERMGDLADLDQSIESSTQAISLTPEGDLDLPQRLNNLGLVFHAQFLRLGNLTDLEKSIDYCTQGIALTPEGDSDLPNRLHSLGESLLDRFQGMDALVDLDKSVEYKHRAVLLTPEDHPDRPSGLNTLGVSLHTRFERLGDLADLNKSIEYFAQTVSLTPGCHSSQPKWLYNLAISLHTRFEQTDDLADLDKNIKYLSQAISLTPETHLDLPEQLHSLGVSLEDQFKCQGDLADLDKSIEYKRRAVLLTPEIHSNRPRLLNSLGSSLHTRFERMSDLADLEESINYSTQAISLAPEGHSGRPSWLNSLGVALYSRFQHLEELVPPPISNEHGAGGVPTRSWSEDLQKSISCFQSAAESTTGSPADRFRAAVHWARVPREDHTVTVIPAYKQILKILPQLVWLGTPVESRYKLILDVAGSLSTEAVAKAIREQNYSLAIEWMEESRSIVWKQMLRLRTPIDELSSVDLTLATNLKQVAHDLDHASSPKPMNRIISYDEISLEQAAQRHRQLAAEWEKLVNKARNLPGFEAFLRPQKAAELMRSARSGPVVVVNIHECCCDALIIQPGVTEISHIPLEFSSEQASRSRAQMLKFIRSRGLDVRGVRLHKPEPRDEFRRALGILWKNVVKPVLDFLGYLELSSTGELPHITWCTTGPLSFLPLHAAGDYDSQQMVFNYAVSSYAPTLSALIPSDTPHPAFSGILAVGQESTPGMSPLPGTVNELTRIQEKAQGYSVLQLDRRSATPAAVMAGMESHSWVHLACHALQNPTSPLQSAFYLHGGALDLATITQKQLKNADLAFLSACQTATGDESLSEEAVHLAAGMLMAGYRSVIATMWSIGDDDAPLIAEKVYEHLLEGDVPDSRKAAVAVHNATAYLRAKVGVEAFQKWVPYIHIGM